MNAPRRPAGDPPATVVPADAEGIRRAAELLRGGSVVAFPTETVYGLGADAASDVAVAEVYRLKGRPTWNPLIVHVRDVAEARRLVARWSDTAEALATRYWPGPLTLVLDRAPHLPSSDVAQVATIAVRVPAHPVALALLEESGLALAAPSANRSGAVSPTTPQHVLRSLPDVPLVLDGGPCRFGIESTVVDVRGGTPRLLRPGALPLRWVSDVVGHVETSSPSRSDGQGAPSPGMGRQHYSPRADVVIRPSASDAADVPAGRAVGLLVYDEPRGAPVAAHVELLPVDPLGYAADLYAALHRLDDAGVDVIVVQEPPPGEDWLAIHDRLRRAAA